MTTFSDLGLAEALLKALASEGYDRPTPIQAQAIPQVLAGRDLVGAAQTGTGKTAAFALPLLQRLSAEGRKAQPRTVRSLILAPTRELAAQIEELIRTYGRFLRLSSAVIFGGVGFGHQRKAIGAGLDILVATPGRMLDLVDEGTLRLDRVEVLVLDEADRMLDLGFIHSLKRIATLVPKQRQTLFFSATMPKPIRELAGKFLNDPVEVAVAPVASTADTVEQRVIMTRGDRKPALLAHVLNEPGIDRAIVFTRTKHGADKVVRFLVKAGIPTDAIHGNKSQAQRERALDGFKSGRTPILVATDIAARGIDVDNVSLVVNYDLPNIAESYVHRIGRTGRAGATGRAIAFCIADERSYLTDIERLIRRRIERLDEPEAVTTMSPEKLAAAGPASGGPAAERQSGDRGDRSGRSNERIEGRNSGRGGPRHEGRGGRTAEGRGRTFDERGPRAPRPTDAVGDARPSGGERRDGGRGKSHPASGDQRRDNGRGSAPARFADRNEAAKTDRTQDRVAERGREQRPAFGDLVKLIADEEQARARNGEMRAPSRRRQSGTRAS